MPEHEPVRTTRRHRFASPRPRRRLWAAVLSVSLLASMGGVVWASADTGSPLRTSFDVVDGTVQRAAGTPMPAGGTHVGMWWNRSTVSKTLEGPGRVVMSGVGSWCQGWPLVRMRVNGKIWWQSFINSADRYGRYPMGPALPPGSHRVSFQMVNDRWTDSCDRNAFLADAWIAPSSDGPARPAPTTPAPTTPARPAPTTPAPTTPARPAPTTTAPTTAAPTTAAPTSPPSPRPAGKPGASNTGVPDGTRLTVHRGDLVIRQDGAVVDGLDVHGSIRVDASDVTIKNTYIRGDGSNGPLLAHYVGGPMTVVDSTLKADRPSMYVDGIKGGNMTLRRVEIANVVDSMQVIGGNVLIDASWLHSNAHFSSGVTYQPDGKTHDDNVQVESGSNVTIRGSVLEGADNAALMVTQNAGRVTNLSVTGSWLAGGSCTVNIDDKGRGAITGSRVSGNRFGMSAHHADRCPMLMPRSSQVSVSGNVFDVSGLPALPRNR